MRVTQVTLLLFGFSFWVAVAMAAPGFQRESSQGTDPVYELVSPSGNIHCAAIVYGRRSGSLRCSLKRIASPLPRPARELGCDWDGGRWFSLQGTGATAERIAPCDALLSGKPPLRLAYGSVWRRGPFSCISARVGLLCTNAQGHGLYLSYERQDVF